MKLHNFQVRFLKNVPFKRNHDKNNWSLKNCFKTVVNRVGIDRIFLCCYKITTQNLLNQSSHAFYTLLWVFTRKKKVLRQGKRDNNVINKYFFGGKIQTWMSFDVLKHVKSINPLRDLTREETVSCCWHFIKIDISVCGWKNFVDWIFE